jgi:hypothetical protein
MSDVQIWLCMPSERTNATWLPSGEIEGCEALSMTGVTALVEMSMTTMPGVPVGLPVPSSL